VASTLTVIAVGQRGRAIRQTRLASARELAAAATANLDVDPELSILLALEAIETASDDEVPLKEAVEALHEGIQRDRLLFTLNDPSTGNVAWSPRGDLLATGGTIGGNEAHDAVLWDATTGEVVRRLASAEGDTSTVAFSNDGSMLATSADDSTATVWDTATGEALKTFRTQKDLITAAGSFSPDGRIFALGEFCCAGGIERPTKVRLFDTADWHEIRRIETFGSPVFSPDGSRLLIGDGIWDVATGRRMMTTPGFDGVWRPDGEVVAQFHPEGVAVLLVDAETGRTLDRFPIPGGLIGLAWSPDGTALATGATDGVARVWDATTGAELITLVGHTGLVALVSFSPDGSRLITGGADGTARVWDVSPEGGQEIFASAEQGWLNDVGYSPDATELRTAGDPGGWVWDPVSGERLRPTSSESSFAYSSDGSKVVSNYFGTVRVTDTSSGDELFVLPDTSGTISEVAFDPTGAVLATAHDGNVVRLWDAASGAELREVEGDPLRLESGDDVGFSPDGELVASIGGRATVRVRTVDDGQLVDEWQGNSGQGRALAWDPRGGVLVTGGADGVAIWSAPGFEKIGTLSIGGGVLDLAYSADGRSLFAVGESGTTKIWNTQTWEETLSLEGDEYLTRVAVSPEGDSFATISDEGILRVFAWDLQDLIEIGRAAVSRSLTSSECLQYLHVEACPASDLPLDRAVEPSKISPVDGSYAVALNQRDYSLSLLDGAFRLRWDDGEREGTFEVVGDRLIMTDVTDAECTGRTIEGTWERVGGTLVINDLVVHPTPTCPDDGWASQVFTSEPWIRLGQLSRAG
jgi:WD40 repeat protein